MAFMHGIQPQVLPQAEEQVLSEEKTTAGVKFCCHFIIQAKGFFFAMVKSHRIETHTLDWFIQK